MSFTLRPSAEDDIRNIAKYIATDNPAAARNWRREIMDVCRMLGDLPELGTSREDIPPDLKTFPKGNYLIVLKADRMA